MCDRRHGRARRRDGYLGDGDGPHAELDGRHHVAPALAERLVVVVDVDPGDGPARHALGDGATGVVRLDLAARVAPDVVEDRVVPARMEIEPGVRHSVDERRVEDEELAARDALGDGGAAQDGERGVVVR